VSDTAAILQRIKDTVQANEPGATVILYGSYARGDQRPDSDIDVLILVDREKEEISWDEKVDIIYPLSRVEMDAGIPITPVVYSRKAWSHHKHTPYLENVNREGVLL